MLRRVLFFLLFTLSATFFAQQNEEFRKVKSHFDHQRALFIQSFQNEMNSSRPETEKAFIRQQFAEFMIKLDSIQNYAFLGTLVKVKNLEDLVRINSNGSKEYEYSGPQNIKETNAEYPGGINTLREQIAEAFYSGEILPEHAAYKATVRFVVERDGSVSSVEAFGEHYAFNKQAMVAVYLLPDKFSPATVDGQPVRTSFSLPLTLKFE